MIDIKDNNINTKEVDEDDSREVIEGQRVENNTFTTTEATSMEHVIDVKVSTFDR